VSRIGRKHGVSGAQVSLRWVHQNGVPLSTKSTSKDHLREALDIFTFALDTEDMTALNGLESTPPEAYSFTCDCAWADACKSRGSLLPSPYF